MAQAITDIDLTILFWIHSHLRNSISTAILKPITFLGNNGWFFILVTLLFLCTRKYRKLGLHCALAMVLQGIVVNLAIKILVARPRPYDISDDLIPLIEKMHDYSFPSGHTALAACITTVFYRTGHRRLGICSLILTIIMAYSRMYLGVHYPSDIIGGALVGVLSALIATEIIHAWDTRSK